MPRTLELKRSGDLLIERPGVDERVVTSDRFIRLRPGTNTVSDEDYAILRRDDLAVRMFESRMLDDVSNRPIDWSLLNAPRTDDGTRNSGSADVQPVVDEAAKANFNAAKGKQPLPEVARRANP